MPDTDPRTETPSVSSLSPGSGSYLSETFKDVAEKERETAEKMEKAGLFAEKEHEKLEAQRGPIREKVMATIDKGRPDPRSKEFTEQAPPEPPKPEDYQKNNWAYLGAMSALAAFAGKKARNGSITALNAYAAGVNGYREGNLEAYKNATTQWEEQNRRVLEMNAQRIRKLQNVLNDRSLSIEEQMFKYKMISAESEDRIGWQAADANNSGAVAQHFAIAAGTQAKAEAASQKVLDDLHASNETAQTNMDAVRAFLPTPEGQRWAAQFSPGQKMQLDGLMKAYPATDQGGAGAAAGGWRSPYPPSTQVHPPPGWTPDKLDFEAEKMRLAGPQQSARFSSFTPQERSAIARRSDELSMAKGESPGEVVSGQVERKAAGEALKKLEIQHSAIDSYGRNAMKNGEYLNQLAKKVDKTGVPVIERWTRAGRQDIRGDPDVSEFNAQLRLYIPEVARIAVNPNLTGVLSDSARKEMEEVLPRGASAAQFDRVIKLMRADYERRKSGIEETIAELKRTIGGGQETPPAATEGGWSIEEVR
jgi:hypothetical protein